ncbi:hypothetical protein B484DRAFT_26164 [Ochromonadaceae sp. CCMP2298]|nr:hypothetical protein B484DRAFT_26164 [Ochromonadaceae sp. CCMP2298]
MVDKASYRSIRDQLVTLSVDIDDKDKGCAMLQRKIEGERLTLAGVEAQLVARYQRVMEEELEQHKSSAARFTADSRTLMESKADLVARCTELVEAVREGDREHSVAARILHRDAEAQTEADRKLFRAGYEERLHKFLATKVAEYKDSTARALQPEIGRLQVAHEAELAEAQGQLKQRERLLTESMGCRLQGRLEEERGAAKEELKLSAGALQDKAGGENEGAEREHRRSLQRLGEDQERELARHRQLVRDKGEQCRQHMREEQRLLLEAGQQRVAELKQRHASNVQKLQDEHDRRMSEVRVQVDASTAQSGGRVRRQRSRLEDSDTGSDADILSGVGGVPSGSREQGNSPGGRMTDALEGEGKEADELEVVAALRQAEVERDRQIQVEIRAQETEALRLRRQWGAAAAQEKQQAAQAVLAEDAEAQRRRRRGVGVVAELVVAREQLAKQAVRLEGGAQRAAEEEGRLRGELKVYMEGVSAHKARIVDRQEQHRLIIRDLQTGLAHTLHELREGAAEAEAELREGEERGRRGQAAVERDHSAELARLNAQVKAEVEQLQDSVEAETAKVTRLERLIGRYTQGTLEKGTGDSGSSFSSRIGPIGAEGDSVAGTRSIRHVPRGQGLGRPLGGQSLHRTAGPSRRLGLDRLNATDGMNQRSHARPGEGTFSEIELEALPAPPLTLRRQPPPS